MIVRQDEDSDTEAAKAKLRPLLNLLKEPEAASLTIEQILSRCNLTMNEYEQCLQDINKKTALILKRDPKDCWINNYNPHLLEAWNSNLDVSLILNAYSCIEYLCKYITKKESGLSEYLKTVIDNSDKNTRNKDKYEKNSEDIESALEEFEQNRDVVIDEWCNLAPESEVVRLQCDENLPERHSDDENEQENVPDYNRQSDAVTEIRAVREQPAVDPAVVRVMYQNLNQKQACVFYAIRDWCIQRVCGLNPDPFFFYINGGAGTGKSHLIKCIHSEASKILNRLPANAEEADISNPTVLLTSFTGTAAFSINGSTLHSLLKLPRSLKPPIQGLGNQLDEVRCELINAEIIVIDEISMVSKPLFAYVDARLKQIKGTQRPFGGMSVLAVGDFYQLPPVRQSKPLCVYDPEQIDLWQEHFQMITLTEIMRQKDDVAFAEMLNRIRVKEKTDELSQCDRDLLSQAVTAPEECPIEVLHIYATNKNVESHNTDTLKKLHSNIIIISADDFQKDKCTGRMAQRDKPFTGGRNDLPDTLNVAEGARVMLTRNLDTLNGLVNGAFGILIKVVRSENDGHIIKLGLKFKGAVRRQFPVKLAFACTIHKTQGLTTQTAVVSMKNIFEPGMAYVALSRVTSLSGLYLQDLDENKIYANSEVTAALQTMRQSLLIVEHEKDFSLKNHISLYCLPYSVCKKTLS
uniref:ATP-dependent DNA helicase n=1 Tax=Oreochromis niloticus TaxID=8128 RepID=A0A669BDJ4_ORENI